MTERHDIEKMAEKVRLIKEAATELTHLSRGTQAVNRNAERILASVKMLEINISDVLDIA